jgi:zinc transporter ZupT
LHEIPASFALVSLLLISGFDKRVVAVCLLAYASMSSLGAISAGYITAESQEVSKIIMAIVIGTFLHIATTILFEADSSHKIAWRKLIAIALGLSIVVLTFG